MCFIPGMSRSTRGALGLLIGSTDVPSEQAFATLKRIRGIVNADQAIHGTFYRFTLGGITRNHPCKLRRQASSRASRGVRGRGGEGDAWGQVSSLGFRWAVGRLAE